MPLASAPLEAALSANFPGALPLADFAPWTVRALEPHGITPGHSLSLFGVCRDELLFPFEDAWQQAWGPAFDMTSLGGMLLLGRTGLTAALHHAPGVDGRLRYVVVAMPHIGITADGAVGAVLRPGQTADLLTAGRELEAAAACDIALFSGIVVHASDVAGPAEDGAVYDYVAVHRGMLVIDGVPHDLPVP